MAGVKRRRRLGEAGWRSLLARYSGSGLAVSTFCAREAVSAANFYRWRSQLGVEREDAKRLPVASVVKHDVAKTAFVDLGALSAADALPSGFELRLDLGGGLMLQLRRG